MTFPVFYHLLSFYLLFLSSIIFFTSSSSSQSATFYKASRNLRALQLTLDIETYLALGNWAITIRWWMDGCSHKNCVRWSSRNKVLNKWHIEKCRQSLVRDWSLKISDVVEVFLGEVILYFILEVIERRENQTLYQQKAFPNWIDREMFPFTCHRGEI